MNPFAQYRNGKKPSPGEFYTAASVDDRGVPIRVGDIVTEPDTKTQGIVIAVVGARLFYMIDATATPKRSYGQKLEPLQLGDCAWFTIIGHTYDLAREVARIEATGSTEGGTR